MELTAKEIADDVQQTFDNVTCSYRQILENRIIKLIDNSKKELLTDFLDFLLKKGYCDTDVYCEPPTAIDQYLILNKE